MQRLIALCLAMAALLAAWLSAHAGAKPLEPVAVPSARAELAYLKQVNEWGPPTDPQLLFLLMGQYANAGRHLEGAAELEALMQRFDAQLQPLQKALYLTAIASLKAGGADQVNLLRRIGWVRDSLAMLDEADRLTGGQAWIVHWMSAIVRSRVPGFFGESQRAEAELAWCLAHADAFPHPGWLREIQAERARRLRERGDVAGADAAQAASGLPPEPRAVTFTTPFSEHPIEGHRFAAPRVAELVPGSVYVVSGFEFTEYYFVITADRRELVAIDAGSRPDAAEAALAALRQKLGTLPPLTTVFVTHAHWDHVGGQRTFRALQPAPRFIGRSNFGHELAVDAMADVSVLKRFFGAGYRQEDVLAYAPDVSVEQRTELQIGDTRFVLWPTRGGETDDALLIELPESGTLFVGDIVMPYFGAPFSEEGSVDGLLAAIDQVAALKPRLLLHGHEPLTRVFNSTAMLQALKPPLAWLRDETLRRLALGEEREAVQQANLMPPSLKTDGAEVQLAVLLMRENLINRLYDQHSGYWQAGLKGMERVTDKDRGMALRDYLGVDTATLRRAVERLTADGRHDLAAELLRWHEQHDPKAGANLAAERRAVYLKLAEQYQEFNPFKYILYREQADRVE